MPSALGAAPGLDFVKCGVGKVDVSGVHLLLAQADALASTDRVEWGSGAADKTILAFFTSGLDDVILYIFGDEESCRMVYLAHIAQDGRRQTVSRHLNGTAELCADFAAAFGAGDQGRLAGLAHDIGKYSAAFQRRLGGSTEHVDHATAGASECCKLNQSSAAFAVAGHHGGLPDGGGRGDHWEDKTFCGRMKKAALGKLETYGCGFSGH